MATYHVAKTGNDGNSGTSLVNAKLTIAAGIGLLGSGDWLEIHAGTYVENITSVPSGGSNGYTRLYATAGETVWLIPNTATGGGAVIWLDGPYSYIEFDGINLDGRPSGQGGGWWSTNNGWDVHHIRAKNATVINGTVGSNASFNLGAHALIGATGGHEVLNCTMTGGGLPGLCGFGCSCYGVYVQGPNNVVDGCHIYDTAGAFIQLYGAAGDQPNGNRISNNRLHTMTRTGANTECWGIIVYGGTNNQLYNNIIYDINVGDVFDGNAAIAVLATNTLVYHNTIFNNTNTGINVAAGSSGTLITNNIVYASTGSDYLNAGSGTVLTTNLIGTDPLFTDWPSGDFSLQPTSPAIDAGTTLGAVSSDFFGVTRPQGAAYDIGACEFLGEGLPSGGDVVLVDAQFSDATPSDPNTLTVTLTGLLAGDCITVGCLADETAVFGAVSVADDKANTYATLIPSDSSGFATVHATYALNVAAGTTVITMTTTNPDWRGLFAEAWRGVKTASALDDSEVGSGTSGSALTTPPLDISESGVIVAYLHSFNPAQVTAWTGWTLIEWTANNVAGAAIYAFTTAGNSYTPRFEMPSSDPYWATVAIALKSATAAGATANLLSQYRRMIA